MWQLTGLAPEGEDRRNEKSRCVLLVQHAQEVSRLGELEILRVRVESVDDSVETMPFHRPAKLWYGVAAEMLGKHILFFGGE